jgi:LUC7 N_terminus
MDMGECPKIHSLPLKADYEEARKKKDYGFEYDLEMVLQRYVDDCDRKIKRNQKHLEDIQAPDPVCIILRHFPRFLASFLSFFPPFFSSLHHSFYLTILALHLPIRSTLTHSPLTYTLLTS